MPQYLRTPPNALSMLLLKTYMPAFNVVPMTLCVVMAGQSCSLEGQLRLRQTASIDLINAGRVDICMDGVWGTIAANSPFTPWSEKNAQVACIELGFSGALNSILQHT